MNLHNENGDRKTDTDTEADEHTDNKGHKQGLLLGDQFIFRILNLVYLLKHLNKEINIHMIVDIYFNLD